MRLICGLWNQTGEPVRRATLQAMCDAMQSAVVPGSIDIWTAGEVGFGLLTFHEASSPVAREGGPERVTLADARMDEKAELCVRYGLPLSLTDAGAIATLDMAEAAEAVAGDFAVAQWDPAHKRLLLARDALGVRPLCYHHQPGRHLAFASLPSGVFASGLLARSLDRDALVHELMGLPTTAGTLFRGLKNVPPGHVLTFLPGAQAGRCFWQAQPRPALGGSREDAALQLRTLLQGAVESCLGHAAPVAAHLSGGLDSSAIAVVASRALQPAGRHLLGYSFLSDTWPGLHMEGERPYVEAVLRQEPAIQWQEISAVFSPDWLHDQWHTDAPLVLSHGSPENAVCVHAAGAGAETVLSGWGGDEGITFNGRGAFAAEFRRGRWAGLLREMRHMRQERGFGMRNMLLGDVLGPLVAPGVVRGVRTLAGRPHRPGPSMRDYLQPELASVAAHLRPIATVANPATVQSRLLADGHLSFRANRFATLAARYGMRFCFPLLNRRVVEFALGMPPAWHIHAGWKRRLFREAMEGVLPPAVQWRHSKFRSLPQVPYRFALERERVLARVEQLAANPLVSGLFRMDEVKAVLRGLPQPEAVKDPGAHPTLAALPYLAQLLDYAFFVEQHFSA